VSKRYWITRALLWAGLAFVGLSGTVFAQTQSVTSDSWWLPTNASEHGERIDWLFTLIFAVTVTVMIVVFVFLIALLIKYRHRPGRKVAYIHGNHRLEVIWTLTPAVLLVVMGILSLRVWADVTMRRIDPVAEDVTEVEVLAQQFQWNIRYPGRDGRFGTRDDIGTFDPTDPIKPAIAGLINVPVGKTVRVHLMSKDVLHSFFLPNMRQKRDAVPGLRGELYFKPTKVGVYDIACAELCGPQHYSMNGKLIVMPQEEYDAWLTEQLDVISFLVGDDMEEEEEAEEETSDEDEESEEEGAAEETDASAEDSEDESGEETSADDNADEAASEESSAVEESSGAGADDQ
jgi:cytochrome c oxidase subunit 2